MGDLSKSFSRSEWTCKCGCGFDTVDTELVGVLQEVRDHFDAPVIITPNGGCRCPTHNQNCGGAEKSQHMEGRAADIMVLGVLPEKVYRYLNERYPDRYGLSCYATFVHLDTKPGPARRW